MKRDNYNEHEIQLRIHDEKIKSMQSKLNFLIGTGLTGVVIPIVLHLLKVT
jgi:hypothetical protein